jgi:phage baseplate assembly protein V
MIQTGVISDAQPGYGKVHFEADGVPSDWLPIVFPFTNKDKAIWQLSIGEHVACLMDERCESGVILGAIYSDADVPDAGTGAGVFKITFEDGTYLKYDKGAHKLTANVAGAADVIATGEIKLQGSKIKITGDVEVTGKVDATGIIKSTTDVKAGPASISLLTHTHSGVSTGGGTSGPPVP